MLSWGESVGALPAAQSTEERKSSETKFGRQVGMSTGQILPALTCQCKSVLMLLVRGEENGWIDVFRREVLPRGS